MLRKVKNKEKSVAEKIAETFLHNNNEGDSSSDSGDEAAAPKVIEYDDDEYELPEGGTTEFRKRNVKLLSDINEKYKGKIVSRRDLDSDDCGNGEDYENSDSSVDEETLANFNNALTRNKSIQQPEDCDSTNDDEEELTDNESKENFEDSDSKDDDGDEFEDSDSNDDEFESDQDSANELDSEDENEDDKVISKVNHEAEIQKGLCVQNQLHIWERLLEVRINLQKLLNKANSLPAPQELKDLEQKNNNYQDIKDSTCRHTSLLLENLLSLKKTLTTQFPEMETALKASLKRPSPFKACNMEKPPLKQVCQYLSNGFEEFRKYRNDVLLKWDDRTKLLQPGAGLKKKTFNEEYDVIKKINNALINKSLLIEKSQQLKNNTQGELLQGNATDGNIYEDSDFYHQQLRELIEYKTNTSSNMNEVTKQFIELQKIRQKMKKKVDTRASKGRKLRYVVHNKLVNFMAPNDNYTWEMDSIDELSKSLFV